MKPNPSSHFYLYAKSWYQEGDRDDDLKTIMGNYSGMEKRFVDMRDVVGHLLGLAWNELQRKPNGEYSFKSFIFRTEQNDAITACLSLLALSQNNPEIPLLRPDENILPLVKDVTKEEIEKFTWAN